MTEGPDAAAAVRDIPGGVRIALRAQPRSSRDAIVGPVDDGRGGVALKVAVTAPPVEGEANEAIVRLVAKLLGVPRRQVSIASGEGGRTKTVEVTGVDRAHVLSRLSA
jgi:uncharacterized protein (TIGR00251 family)